MRNQMKINGNEIRVHNVIKHKDQLWRAVKTQAVKPGKGGAYAQVELKNLITGSKLNERFRASETVERVSLEQRDYQFLFAEDELLTFMDPETFDQITASKNLVSDEQLPFLEDGLMVSIETHEEQILGITLPEQMNAMVADADPVVKGQTVSSSYKPAILENGVKILVPPHISAGTEIKVNTIEHTYLEKAKD